jgi:hypothetical protein
LKINNLIVGQTIKNYKELCKVLEIEVKKGNSKNAQLKELATYCDFSKAGHQIIINQIYDIPKVKEDNRGKSEGTDKSRNIYSNLVQLMITDLLARCRGHLSISRSKLLREIGITNENYSTCGENIKKLSRYLDDMDVKTIYDFFNTNNGSFKGVVETALDKLMEKRVLIYHTVYKVSVEGEYFNRNAEQDEEYIIMKFEKEVLEELGYKTMGAVRVSKDWKRFKKKVKKMLNEQSHIKYYYSAYDITINDEYITQEYKELLTLLLEEATRKEYRTKLNETVMENIMKNAQKRHEKSSVTWGVSSDKKRMTRSSETYINDFEVLTKWLIKHNQIDITEEVINTNLEIIPPELQNVLEDELDRLFA